MGANASPSSVRAPSSYSAPRDGPLLLTSPPGANECFQCSVRRVLTRDVAKGRQGREIDLTAGAERMRSPG